MAWPEPLEARRTREEGCPRDRRAGWGWGRGRGGSGRVRLLYSGRWGPSSCKRGAGGIEPAHEVGGEDLGRLGNHQHLLLAKLLL